MTEREDYMLDRLRTQRYKSEQAEKKLSKEEQLRRDNPGLQELWDQYQTMLKLVTPAEEPKTEESIEDILAQIRAMANKSHINVVPSNPCSEVYMPEKPPEEKGKIELNGKECSLDELTKFFNGR